jgi:uncharacterized damage-inducible protein DinB
MASFDLVEALLDSYDTNDRINHYLIDAVPVEAWTLKAPNGKGRDIASIVAHMHNVRLMWLKSAGGSTRPLPAKLEPANLTRASAIEALTESRHAMREVLAGALSTDGRVKGFKPDAASFLAYLLAHDAHHRGQISMVARQLGHPISQSAMFGMWEWGTR